MAVLLPLDDNGNPIHLLGFAPSGTQRVEVGSASVRAAKPLAAETEVVTLIATGPCRFAVGTSSVSADSASPFLFPGAYVDVPLKKGERFVAFAAEGEDCTAYAIERA